MAFSLKTCTYKNQACADDVSTQNSKNHQTMKVCWRERELTLAELCLWDPLPDHTAGIVHHGGGLKLHGLHHVPHADL